MIYLDEVKNKNKNLKMEQPNQNSQISQTVKSQAENIYDKLRTKLSDLKEDIGGIDVSPDIETKSLVELGNDIVKAKLANLSTSPELQQQAIDFRLVVREIAKKLIVEERERQAQLPEEEKSENGENVLLNYVRKLTKSVLPPMQS